MPKNEQSELMTDVKQREVLEVYENSLRPQGAMASTIEDAPMVALLSEFIRRLTGALVDAGVRPATLNALIMRQPELTGSREHGLRSMAYIGRKTRHPIGEDAGSLWDEMFPWEQWQITALAQAFAAREQDAQVRPPEAELVTLRHAEEDATELGRARLQVNRALTQVTEGNTKAAARLVRHVLKIHLSPGVTAYLQGALTEAETMGRQGKMAEWLDLADSALRVEAAAATARREEIRDVIADDKGGRA